MRLKKLHTYPDLGLLLLRIGFGIMFIFHGYPKIMGGPDKWEQLGGAVGVLGITFMPVFWGFMAALAEFGGGILLLLGVFVRPAALMMLSTMIVAASMHLHKGDGLMGASHAIESGMVFLMLLFTGPGRLNLGRLFDRD